MANSKILPEKITSPIQLMAAWFVMLVLLVSILLTAAINVREPVWAAGYLVIFTSALIILVLGCVTLMLTIFRPHLQEGKEYAQWLKDKNSYSQGVVKTDKINARPTVRRLGKTTDYINNKSGEFVVVLADSPGVRELVSALKLSGFRTRKYIDPIDDLETIHERDNRDEAIWIGYELQPRDVLEVIQIAIKHWPYLKYMELSNDGVVPPDEVHREMFLGGSSSTAEDRGLLPWSNEEIMSINKSITQEDFHQLIRSRYP